MIPAILSALDQQRLAELRQWFESQWHAVDSFQGNHPAIAIPAPIMALDESQKLIAGLAFTTHTKPNSKAIGVWINVLLVAPNHRGRGIASQLIQTAERKACDLGFVELFVSSAVPALYQRLGWQLLSSNGEDAVLTKMLLHQA